MMMTTAQPWSVLSWPMLSPPDLLDIPGLLRFELQCLAFYSAYMPKIYNQVQLNKWRTAPDYFNANYYNLYSKIEILSYDSPNHLNTDSSITSS